MGYHGDMSVDPRLSSIHGLYMAMAKGEISGFTVPAINLRGMTEELAQGIFEAAKESNTGAFILEVARSEMGYTSQYPLEFVRRVLIGANKAGWNGPIFVQGDHSQVKSESPGQIAEGEIEKIKKLIDAEIESGFYNIDIDASTLVDISLPTVTEQQTVNANVTAELAQYIRSRQPKGIEISIGGEIGHIGDRNSTEEDLATFFDLFKSKYPNNLVGLSKVSVQTGTSHGGHMLADGKMESMKVDFDVMERLSRQAKLLGMAGVVQHGASTLPESMFSEFPKHGAIEIHLSTGWQNMIFDHPQFPQGLKKDIYAWLDREKSDKRKDGETNEQFYYRVRKYAWGEFQSKIDELSSEFKTIIKNEMKVRCLNLFRELKVAGTQEIVEKYIGNRKSSDRSLIIAQGSELRTVEQVDVRGKKVLVRVDWNVTLGKALQIVDDTRIVRTLPTIKWLQDKGAKQIILMSHLGKPKGIDPSLSLKSVVEYAANLIGQEIELVDTLEKARKSLSKLVMLENLRFWDGEELNEINFVKELASLGEIYVNEAFGESHRPVASIVGLPGMLPSYGGMWLLEEVETILRVRNNPEHPYVVVMGGAKVEDKIKLIEILSQQADVILLGGKLANEFVQRGIKVSGKARIISPSEGSELMDIGITTQKQFSEEIKKAKTIVWNGPMGKVEELEYRLGTQAIYDAISANEEAFTLVGGGDTLASISSEEHLNRIDHVSTGGGAMLKLLEQGSLVGLLVLQS